MKVKLSWLFLVLMVGSILSIPGLLLFALLNSVALTDTFVLMKTHMVLMLIAAASSILLGIASRNAYLNSRNSFFKWLSWGYVAFGVIYAFHGVFTMQSNLGLFLVYGPFSRLVFAWFVCIALMANPLEVERKLRLWLIVLLSLAVSGVVYVYATLHVVAIVEVKFLELMSLLTLLVVLPVMRTISKKESLLGGMTAAVVVFLAGASVLFLLGKPWNIVWWLAHAVLGAGFFTLAYSAFSKAEAHDFHVDE